MRTEEEIEIKDIFYILIKGYKVIIASVCIFVLIAFLFSAYSSDPHEERYVTDASMVIHSEQIRIVGGEMMKENVIHLSQQMVNTYQVILLSDRVLDRVNEDLGTDMSPSQMRGWISVTSPKDSEVLIVSVQHTDPELAAGIANSMMKVAPGVIAETVEVGTINVVDYAKVPEVPSRGIANYPLNISVGAVLGFMLGTFIVFLMNYWKPKIKNNRDVVETLSLNVMGEITHSEKTLMKRPLITNENIERHFIESFKIAALNVLHNSTKLNYKKILMTSASEKEGKTTAVNNLGIALAQIGKSVLVLECDIYNFNFILNMDRSRKCLIDVLKGDCDYKDVLIEEKSGLHILPSKGESSDQSKLINSQQMWELMEALEEEYDIILIDTPPLLALSDAAYLSKLADGAVLVVRQEHESVDSIISARDTLLSLEVDIIGAILNDIRFVLAEKKYIDKYRFDYGAYYSAGSSTKPQSQFFTLRRNKTFFWVVFVIWMVVIGYFTTRTGDQLVQMNENTMHFIFETMESLGFVEDRIGDLYEKRSGITVYGSEMKYWGGTMEHWIHTFLFFGLTLITLEIMRLYNFSILKKALLTLGISSLVLVGNELYQSFMVDGRAYEFRDVIFGYIGVIAGFTVHFIHQLIREMTKDVPREKTTRKIVP